MGNPITNFILRSGIINLLPEDHLRDLNERDLNNIEAIGRNVFKGYIENSPELKSEWLRITGSDNPGYFRLAYQSYVTDGEIYMKTFPEEYKFLKKYVFLGREFSQNEVKTKGEEVQDFIGAIEIGEIDKWG